MEKNNSKPNINSPISQPDLDIMKRHIMHSKDENIRHINLCILEFIEDIKNWDGTAKTYYDAFANMVDELNEPDNYDFNERNILIFILVHFA